MPAGDGCGKAPTLRKEYGCFVPEALDNYSRKKVLIRIVMAKRLISRKDLNNCQVYELIYFLKIIIIHRFVSHGRVLI